MRYQRFNLASVPARAVLEPGIRVRLQAPSPWPSQVDRNKVTVTLRRKEAKGDVTLFPMGATARKSFGLEERLELVVPGPGTYYVLWMGERGGQSYLRLRNIFRTCSSGRVEVIEASGVQDLDLNL